MLSNRGLQHAINFISPKNNLSNSAKKDRERKMAKCFLYASSAYVQFADTARGLEADVVTVP